MDQPTPEVERVIRKLKRKRKLAKNLAILEADESPAIARPAEETKIEEKKEEPADEKMSQKPSSSSSQNPQLRRGPGVSFVGFVPTPDQKQRLAVSPIKADKPEPVFLSRAESPDLLELSDPELEEMVVVKKRDQPAKSSLSELAAQIRKNIDSMPDENHVPKKKKGKKLKGEELKFVKVADEPSEPAGTAFVTAAQRKLMKKQKKKPLVNKQAVKDNYAKEFKLKFREQLVEFKPFKKLDKPEVVGTHQGESSVPNAGCTPTKSCLRVKTPPRKIIGNKGKLKWQG